ncbi:hypothetical protein PS3A_18950 [Pseudomonas sp. 3A(2025)]
MTIEYLKLRTVLVALMAGVLLGGCAGPLRADDSAPGVKTADPGGTVTLYTAQDNGVWPYNCSFPFTTRTVVLNDNDSDTFGCMNDQIYGFKLTNVPSASRITFYDSGNCDDNNDIESFIIKLMTYINPTTMLEPYNLKTAHQKEPGDILVAGVRMMWKKGPNSDNVNGELTCVRMELSPAP